MTIVFIYWNRDNNGCANYNLPHTFEIDMADKNATQIMREYTEIVDNINPFLYTAPEFCGII